MEVEEEVVEAIIVAVDIEEEVAEVEKVTGRGQGCLGRRRHWRWRENSAAECSPCGL